MILPSFIVLAKTTYMSRHPNRKTPAIFSRQQELAEEYINLIVVNTAPNAMTVQEIKAATANDAVLQAAISAVRTGRWAQVIHKATPEHTPALEALQRVGDELSVTNDDNILLRGTRLVIPCCPAKLTLAHEGHHGVVKTKSLLSEKV